VSSLDGAVRALRSPGEAPSGPRTRVETEIFPDGSPKKIGTVYLRNGACPLACVYCALYRSAAEGPASGDEVAGQIREARRRMPDIAGVKLYNASSLFEPGSIRQTPEDLSAIAREVSDLELVVVEARSENAYRAVPLAPLLSGKLEVAIGLEAADDGLLALLNKPTTVARFRQACAILARAGILVRAFVLVQPPFVSGQAARELALRTFELAGAQGARVVSLLPVVSSHEPMERLRRAGFFAEPTLDDFFEVVAACAGRSKGAGGAVVVAETEWLDRLPACGSCRTLKIEALERLNGTGELVPPSCAAHRRVLARETLRPRDGEEVARALAG
jgi:radical SAM enzyme (TIGR01210 family)